MKIRKILFTILFITSLTLLVGCFRKTKGPKLLEEIKIVSEDDKVLETLEIEKDKEAVFKVEVRYKKEKKFNKIKPTISDRVYIKPETKGIVEITPDTEKYIVKGLTKGETIIKIVNRKVQNEELIIKELKVIVK